MSMLTKYFANNALHNAENALILTLAYHVGTYHLEIISTLLTTCVNPAKTLFPTVNNVTHN